MPKSERAQLGAALRLGRLGHQVPHVLIGRLARGQLLHLVLGEIADHELVGGMAPPHHRRKPAGHQPRECTLAVAVGAQQADAIVGIEPQVEALQHRLGRHVADRGVLQPDERAGEGLGRVGKQEGRNALRDGLRDRLHARQRLDAALRLGGLRGLGLEARDERLNAAPLVVLLLPELGIEALLLAPRLLEGIVAAGIERELALAQVQDGRDGAIEQVAVVADDHNGVAIFAQMVLKPQRPFKVEVVGGLVEQKEVGLGEQGGRQRHARAPAAGKFRAGALLGGLVEPQARQNARGPCRRGVSVNVGEALVDVGDAAGVVCRLRLGKQRHAFPVGGQNEIDQALRAAGRLLRHPADAGGARNADPAGVGCQLAGDQAHQRSLAGAVAADETDLVPGGNAGGRLVEQGAPFDAVGQVVDVQHGRWQ